MQNVRIRAVDPNEMVARYYTDKTKLQEMRALFDERTNLVQGVYDMAKTAYQMLLDYFENFSHAVLNGKFAAIANLRDEGENQLLPEHRQSEAAMRTKIIVDGAIESKLKMTSHLTTQ